MIKKSLPFQAIYLLVLLTVIVFSCDNEENGAQKGKVEFSFRSKSSSKSGVGREASVSLRYVMITVEDLSGNKVYDRKKIELLTFGDTYLSEPVDFQPGNFVLTEFLVLDESSTIKYAAPIEGSPLANLVDDPLGIGFTISRDLVTKITPQVISTEGFTAPDFGYATFSFDIVNPLTFNLAVFAYNSSMQNLELISSFLRVKGDTAHVLSQELSNVTTLIAVKDGYSSYQVNITKPGYQPYEKTFTAAELSAYNAGVLKVVLIENVDMSMQFDGLDDYINLGNIYDSVHFPITISAWVKLDSSQEYVAPIFDSQHNDALYNGFQFCVTTSALFLQYGDGYGENNPAFRGGKSAVNQAIAGRWLHVAAIARSESNISLFINGVDVGGTEQGDSPNPMNSNFPNALASIGKSSSNGLNLFFKGYIDDVTVWNKAIGRANIPALMTTNITGSEDGLIGHWNFNEPSGDAVLDKSPFGYNGTIFGGAQRVVSTAPN